MRKQVHIVLLVLWLSLALREHCTQCGAKISPGAKFFGECGAKI